MKYSLIALYLYLTSSLFAQNLVPNPGFEKHKKLPSQFMQSAEAFNGCMQDWAASNTSTPDFITVGFLRPGLFGTSHTKLSMVGLAITSPWAEGIYAKLNQEMEANTTYLIEFWMKRPARNFIDGSDDGLPNYVNPDFGILLSDTLQMAPNKEFIKGDPQLRCGDKLWVGKDWIKVSGSYTTDKAYRYIYVGQFRPTGETGPLVGSGYVLVDDGVIKKMTFSDQMTSTAAINPGVIIPLDKVYFELDKAELLETSLASLDTLVRFLNANTIKIRINGHTDNQGTTKHNHKLSASRANAVGDYLISKGIDKKRVSWQGFGETKPKADNATVAGQQKNRRVEFEIVEM